MRRRLLFASALIAVIALASVSDAGAQGFVTTARIDCLRDTSASTAVELYRAGLLLSTTQLLCADGAATTVDIVTAEEPDVWVITQGSFCSENTCALCAGEMGSRFPAIYQCGSGQSGGFHVIVFRPRPAQ